MITKIIIADDSKDFRMALRALLEEIYDTHFKTIGQPEFIKEAENGEDLLKKIKTSKPELIFMDIEMPFMNGFEATEIIASRYPEIKIIGISAYEKENYIIKLIDYGAHGYFIKSGDNYEVIKELISQKCDSFIYSPEINKHEPLLKGLKTILFIDKNRNNNLNLRHSLRKCGYTIHAVKNIIEAKFQLKDKNIFTLIVNGTNENNISQLLNVNQKLKIIQLSNTNLKTETANKLHHKIINIKKEFTLEDLVKQIEK